MNISYIIAAALVSTSSAPAAPEVKHVSLMFIAVLYALALFFAGLLFVKALCRKQSVVPLVVGLAGMVGGVAFIASRRTVDLGSVIVSWPFPLPLSVIAAVVIFAVPVIIFCILQVLGRRPLL